MNPGVLTQPEIRAVIDNWHWKALNRRTAAPDLTIPEEATDEEAAAAMGDALRKLVEQTKA